MKRRKIKAWLDFPMPRTPRRKTPSGRPVHCCCVCGNLAPWSKDWSWYGSHEEVDDGMPVQKFCSGKCKKHQKAVTDEMAFEARLKEHLEAA